MAGKPQQARQVCRKVIKAASCLQSGDPCKNLVDKSVCGYCEFHVQSQLKALKAKGRAQLRDSNLQATLRKAEIAYGGELCLSFLRQSQHEPRRSPRVSF